MPASLRRPSFEMFELDAQHGGLHPVQPAVRAEFLVQVPTRAAVIAQPSHMFRPVGVGGCDQPGITVRAKVLTRIKAETRGLAHRTSTPVAPRRSNCLGSVFH